MTEELKPCPFCGGEFVQIRFIGFTFTHNGAFDAGFRGECCDCCAITKAFDTEEEAAKAWNTRAAHGTLTADDVRDLIERHSAWVIGNNRCFHNGAYEAIADELNATERWDGTRWHELFGTPERAARTLENGTPLCSWCDTQACDKKGGECPLLDYNALLEWLRGDAEWPA